MIQSNAVLSPAPYTSMRRRISGLILSLILAAAVIATLAPATVLAAEPTDVWQSVGVSINDLGSGMTPTLVIIAQARPGLAPPLQAALAIPKGAVLSWAGEVLGGDPNDDPTLQVTIEKGEAYDLVKFTLANSPRVQLELTVPPEMLVRTETQAKIDLKYTSAGPLDAAAIQVYVPADAHLEGGTPAPEVYATPGQYVVYSVETSPVVAGQVVTLAGTVVSGPAPEMAESEGQAPAEADAALDDQPTVADAGKDGDLDLRVPLGLAAAVLVGVAGYLIFRFVRTSHK